MSNRIVNGLVAAMLCWSGTILPGAEVPVPARVLKHSAANGESYFAIVLKAGELPKGIIVHDHVILIDTSASQVGEHRLQSINVLVSLLKSLPDGDRVRLFGADLRAESLDDGFHEVHVNTMEGCWSLLRSWLRPHRGISQEKLPLYVGFFQFVHNARKRGKALLESLVTTLLTKPPRNAG